jgi:hypothetical protein
MDWWIMRLQTSIVNALSKIDEPSKMLAKWIPTSASFLHALPQHISSKFCICLNLSCFTKLGERGMSKCQGQLVIKQLFAVLETIFEGPTKPHFE